MIQKPGLPGKTIFTILQSVSWYLDVCIHSEVSVVMKLIYTSVVSVAIKYVCTCACVCAQCVRVCVMQ